MAKPEKQTSRTEKTRKGAPKRKKARFRLLPLVIFFSVLMLSVRVGVLWRSLFSLEAQEELTASSPVAVGRVQALAEEIPADETSKVSEAVRGAPVRPADSSFSQSELEVLQKLAERREELDKRARFIEQQAAVLKVAEAQIDAKISKLRELEASIKDLVGAYDKKERERLNNLVKIYSAMKPKDAARLFNEMDMGLLTRLFERMKESKSAPILAAMDAAKATALTSELANKKKLPGFEVSEDVSDNNSAENGN